MSSPKTIDVAQSAKHGTDMPLDSTPATVDVVDSLINIAGHLIGIYVVDLPSTTLETIPIQRELDHQHIENLAADIAKNGILHTEHLIAILLTDGFVPVNGEIVKNVKLAILSGQHRVAAVQLALGRNEIQKEDAKWTFELYSPSKQLLPVFYISANII